MNAPAAYALILAAGTATRFGSNKLLADFRGRPLLAHPLLAVAQAVRQGALAGGFAVVPAGDEPITGLVRANGLVPVSNPNPSTGLAGSLQVGFAALMHSGLNPEAQAALIVLGDQPGLTAQLVQALVTHWRATGCSVRPRYTAEPETPGHPVLLHRSLWAAALTVKGDRGFGAVLKAHQARVNSLEVAGANPDIDTPDDLAALEGER